MKFIRYKQALVGLLFTSALLLGLYLELRVSDKSLTKLNIDSYDEFLIHGLRTGEIYCLDSLKFKLVYPDKIDNFTTRQFCDIMKNGVRN